MLGANPTYVHHFVNGTLHKNRRFIHFRRTLPNSITLSLARCLVLFNTYALLVLHLPSITHIVMFPSGLQARFEEFFIKLSSKIRCCTCLWDVTKGLTMCIGAFYQFRKIEIGNFICEAQNQGSDPVDVSTEMLLAWLELGICCNILVIDHNPSYSPI